MYLAILIALGWAALPSAPAQQPAALQGTETLINSLSAPDWHTRATAFYALMRLGAAGDPDPGLSARTRTAFIELLARENEAGRRADEAMARGAGKVGGGVEGEAEGEYFGDVIQAVTELHDQRAIPILLDDIETGEMVADALAGFGDAVVPSVIKMLSAGDSGTIVCISVPGPSCVRAMHTSAVVTLAAMCQPSYYSKLNPNSQSEVRSTLIGILASPDRFARVDAVNGLDSLRDPTLEPTFLQLAGHDGSANVRAMAVKAIGDLKDKRVASRVAAMAENDPDDFARGTAAIALGQLGDAASRPVLEKLAASDRSKFVRESATAALKALSSQ